MNGFEKSQPMDFGWTYEQDPNKTIHPVVGEDIDENGGMSVYRGFERSDLVRDAYCDGEMETDYPKVFRPRTESSSIIHETNNDLE